MWRLKCYLILILLSNYLLIGFEATERRQKRTSLVPLLIVPPTAPTRHQVFLTDPIFQNMMFSNISFFSSFGALVYHHKLMLSL